MPYPIISMKLPNGITAPMNGKLFPTQLAPINLPGLGMGTLHPLAVQAFNCLFLIAQIETGQTMTATSNAVCPAAVTAVSYASAVTTQMFRLVK